MDVTPEQVRDLVVRHVREVLALEDDEGRVPTGSGSEWDALRFDADLGADSLDLVEVVEGVERALRERGIRVALPDAELVALQRVGDAVARIAELAAEGRP